MGLSVAREWDKWVYFLHLGLLHIYKCKLYLPLSVNIIIFSTQELHCVGVSFYVTCDVDVWDIYYLLLFTLNVRSVK